MISIKSWETPLSWHAKCSLPVAVRVSKKCVLKLPNTNVTKLGLSGAQNVTPAGFPKGLRRMPKISPMVDVCEKVTQ